MHLARTFILSVAVLLLAASTATATPNAGKQLAALPAIAAAPAFSPQDLMAQPNGNWITTGGNSYNQRYSPLNLISTSNVTGLKEAWHIHLDGSGAAARYSQEGTPLVYNGVMYVVTGNDDVFAVDAATGARLWTYLSHTAKENSTVCCGWDARGVGLGDGKVFVAQLDGSLVALDQMTGDVMWRVKNARWQEGYTMTMSPDYYNGQVIVGVSGAEFGVRGSVTSYDANTGSRLWRFYPVPQPGDIGSGTWPANNEWMNGGASVWNNPTIDPTNGLLYFTTGNADKWSGRGPGGNLFTSSFVALDAKTGTYHWHFQVVHHDLWDYDCPSPTLLFDTQINGQPVRGVAEACKTGWLYELNRDTGQPLIPGNIVEKKVPQNRWNNTAATQPYVTGDAFSPQCARKQDFKGAAPDGKPYKIGCIFLPYDYKQFAAMAPSALGGDNWMPMSWNPQTHALYVCSSNSDISYEAVAPAKVQKYVGGKGFTNIQFGKLVVYGGTFTAMDATTNKIMWQQKWGKGDACYAGSLSTGGNLVFVGHNSGLFEADDAATGERLWSQQLVSGANAPAMTYTVNGKQYVAILDGGNSIGAAFGGGGAKAAKKNHGDSVYAFALG